MAFSRLEILEEIACNQEIVTTAVTDFVLRASAVAVERDRERNRARRANDPDGVRRYDRAWYRANLEKRQTVSREARRRKALREGTTASCVRCRLQVKGIMGLKAHLRLTRCGST